MATKLTLTVQQVSEHVAELILTNPAPRVMFTSSKDYVTHVFGAVERPRFRMEQPYSPDDAWSLEVDPTGALSANLPPGAQPITVDLDAFFERQLDELSHRLLGALPSGRYMIVRSLRTPEAKDTVLLGNELVPAKPN